MKNVATLDKVSVDITVVLGTTSMPVHQVLRLGRGAIIELDSSEDDAVSILANNLPVAKGTVVVNGNRIAVEVGEIDAPAAGYALSAGSRILRPLSLKTLFVTATALRRDARFCKAFRPLHAAMAELVDALA